MNLVHIVGDPAGLSEYAQMFRSQGWLTTSQLKSADLVQFTGGEDVSPSLYNEQKHPRTYCNPYRDTREQLIFKAAQEAGIPCAGICRGGQFLNVMCGGSMWQHVDGHTGSHMATDLLFNQKLKVTSTHHQMMKPTEEAEILMVAKECRSKERAYPLDKPMSNSYITRIGFHEEEDIEAVLYEDFMSLCFQPHPEFPGEKELRELYFLYVAWTMDLLERG